MAFILHKTN